MSINKIRKLQISHCRSVSTDPLGTGHGGSTQHNLEPLLQRVDCLEGEDRRFLKILTHHITLFQSYISAVHAEVCARSSAAEVHYFNYRRGSKYVHYTGFQVRINENTLSVCARPRTYVIRF